MNINELTRDKLQPKKTLMEWIDMAETMGDVDLGAALLREAAIYIHNGLPMPQPLSAYMACALCRASISGLDGSKGEDIRKIFNIKVSRGGGTYKNSPEQMKLCAAVQLEILKNPDLHLTTEDGICGNVATKYDKKDTGNVVDAYKSEHKNRLEKITKKPLEKMTKTELEKLIEMLESMKR